MRALKILLNIEFRKEKTPSPRLLAKRDAGRLRRTLKVHTKLASIQEFTTENEFSERIRSFYQGVTDADDDLLILQCGSGHKHQDLLTNCRYIIVDEYRRLREFEENQPRNKKHVVLAVQLPRKAGGCFIGFQMKPWECVHIDELHPYDQMPPTYMILNRCVSSILKPPDILLHSDGTNKQTDSDHPRNSIDFKGLFKSCIIPAVSILVDENEKGSPGGDGEMEKKHRNISRIDKLNSILKQTNVQANFLSIVQKRTYLLQEDREKNYEYQPVKWLNRVAKNSMEMKLLTFRSQVQRYAQKKVTGLIAGIVAFADSNSNLDILLKDEPWKKHMWLRLLDSQKAIKLSIEEDLGQSDPQEIPVKSYGANGSKMEGRLPFSWRIFQQIDDCMKSHKDKGIADAVDSVTTLLRNDDLWTIVVESLYENAEDNDDVKKRIVDNYLPDFVAIVYKAQTADTSFEHELIQEELYQEYSRLLAKQDNCSLSHHIPLIHGAYAHMQPQIERFSQIVQRCPEVVEKMKEAKTVSASVSSLEMKAVQHVIDIMQPTQSKLRQPEDSKEWYKRTGSMAPIINHAFHKVESRTTSDDHVKLMNEWQRVITVRMFASVVCPPESDQASMLLLCPLLWRASKEANMKTEETMKKVDDFLQRAEKLKEEEFVKRCKACGNLLEEVYHLPCSSGLHENCVKCIDTRIAAHSLECIDCSEGHPETIDLQKHSSSGKDKCRSFKNRLQFFRLELVSRLCLSGPAPPAEKLIQLLLTNITAECEDVAAEWTVKTVLLQFMMANHLLKVKNHLDVFFGSQPKSKHCTTLATVYTQCFEDKHNLSSNTKSKADTTHEIVATLQKCTEPLKATGLNTNRLEAIALTRFCLSATADWLEKVYIQKSGAEASKNLLTAVQKLCLGELSWPRKYLAKVLARRFGVDIAVNLSKIRELEWLLDEELKVENADSDPFILYGAEYKNARTHLMSDLRRGTSEQIRNWLRTKKSGEADHILMLAVVREIKIKGQLKQDIPLRDYLRKIGNFKQKDLLLRLLSDSLAVKCQRLCLRNKVANVQDRVIQELLVHFYITLRNTQTVSILEPFKQLMHKPAEMKNSYLPTMPQDNAFEVMQGVKAVGSHSRLYECPNGHRYAITECGLPNQRSICPNCKVAIGGTGKFHELAKGNKEVSQEDQTKKGHILGTPAANAGMVPERNLSQLETNIMRLLLHLSMYLGANHDVQAICGMIDPAIPEKEVPGFLWSHLQNDFKNLTKTMSIDDTLLLMHNIIIKLAGFTEQRTDLEQPLLLSKASRGNWEDKFSAAALRPTLSRKDEIIREGQKKMTEDGSLGIKKFLDSVYENKDVDENDNGGRHPVNMAIMWRYRQQVTFDTAAQKLAELRCRGSTKQGRGKQHELLHYFMRNESVLRYVQLLPSVISFHKLLLLKYDHKITHKGATDTEIGAFLSSLPDKEGKRELERLFKDYQKVWDGMNEHFHSGEVPNGTSERKLNRETKLIQFLPMSAALESLIQVHNGLIEQLDNKTFSTCILGPDVNLLDVKPTHLVTYDPDKDLLPLVTANCSASLELGQGTNVEYNFENMENQLREGFLEGKSKIVELEIPMVFSDSLTAVHKLKKLEVKIPQIPFPPPVEAELYKDAQDADLVCLLVEGLNTAIGFLHTVGGNGTRPLEAFMREDLKMNPIPLPSRTQKHCMLQNIKPAWLFMSNELEKHAAKLGAVPFATLTENKHDRLRDELNKGQKAALKEKLAHVDLEKLLMELFTCIMLHIIHLDDEDNIDAPLCDHLVEMEDIEIAVDALQLPQKTNPIAVSQCMYLWRDVYNYSQNIAKKNRRFPSIRRSFKRQS